MRFFDTNILVYAVSNQDARKRAIAQELLSHALMKSGRNTEFRTTMR